MNNGVLSGLRSSPHSHRPARAPWVHVPRMNSSRGIFSGWNPNPNWGEWQPWFPVLTQSAIVAATINYARYLQQGKRITATFDLTAAGAGTTSNNITVSVPVPSYLQPAGVNLQIGSMLIYRLSVTTRYVGNAELINNVGVGLSYSQASSSLVGVAPAFALAAGDIIRGTLTYEAA